MTGDSRQRTPEGGVRAIYEEYAVDGRRVARIVDQDEESAWIESDYTVPVKH